MSSNQYSDHEVLEIFSDTVDELLASRFLSQAKNDGVSTTLNWSQSGSLVAHRSGPEHEAVKAFLLTLRFFCQNNEPTSLCNMEERISGLSIDAQVKQNFRKSRENFNSSLDGPPSVLFPAGSGADTRRDIFWSFLYGVFAHANPKYRSQVKVWEGQQFYLDIQAQFDLILLDYLRVLITLANICRKVLESGVTQPQ
jgi:hypothetical protein